MRARRRRLRHAFNNASQVLLNVGLSLSAPGRKNIPVVYNNVVTTLTRTSLGPSSLSYIHTNDTPMTPYSVVRLSTKGCVCGGGVSPQTQMGEQTVLTLMFTVASQSRIHRQFFQCWWQWEGIRNNPFHLVGPPFPALKVHIAATTVQRFLREP